MLVKPSLGVFELINWPLNLQITIKVPFLENASNVSSQYLAYVQKVVSASEFWQEVGFALFWKSGLSLERFIISCKNWRLDDMEPGNNLQIRLIWFKHFKTRLFNFYYIISVIHYMYVNLMWFNNYLFYCFATMLLPTCKQILLTQWCTACTYDLFYEQVDVS